MANKHGSLSIDSDNLFPIIKKWLYSDHDIFYRELISNGCDAITKLKKLDIRRSAPQNWIKYLRGENDKKPEPIEVYIYVSKERSSGERLLQIEEADYHCKLEKDCDNEDLESSCDILNQQIIAKFTLTEVEAIDLPYTKFGSDEWVGCEEARTLQTKTMDESEILEKACLFEDEIYRYLNFSKKPCGYAWHIEDLVIFDQPKKLSKFKRCTEKTCIYGKCHKYMHCLKSLTKAPQSWGYCEDE